MVILLMKSECEEMAAPNWKQGPQWEVCDGFIFGRLFLSRRETLVSGPKETGDKWLMWCLLAH